MSDLPPLPERPRDAHKGSMGRVLLVAGRRGMAGAAVLAATGALRGGAGYAVVACPGAVADVVTVGVPEAVLAPHGDRDREGLRADDLDALLATAATADALVVGPGLGRDPGVADWVPRLLLERPDGLPAVADADALFALSEAGALGDLDSDVVLTPHPGEAARLLGWDEGAARVQADRAAALAALVAATPAVVVLKGAGTLVGRRGDEPWRNATGNPGLATAGSGDVLAGLVGALAARGLDALGAARLGVHLHGLAGDLAALDVGVEGLVASDVAAALGRACRLHAARTGGSSAS